MLQKFRFGKGTDYAKVDANAKPTEKHSACQYTNCFYLNVYTKLARHVCCKGKQ